MNRLKKIITLRLPSFRNVRGILSALLALGCGATAGAVEVPRNFTVISNEQVKGAAELVKTGAGTLSLINSDGASNDFSGNITVGTDGGTLKIGGNLYKPVGTAQQGLVLNSMTSGNTITIKPGGTFYIEENALNGVNGHIDNRFGSSGSRPSVSLLGGSLYYNGNNHFGTTQYQTFGPMTLGGGSVITVNANGGQTPRLVFSSLVAPIGASVNMAASVSEVLGGPKSQIYFTAAPSLVGGILGGYARSGWDWATYISSGVTNLTAYDNSGAIQGGLPAHNVKVAAAQTITSDNTINSLNLNSSNNLNLATFGLRLVSGGYIYQANAPVTNEATSGYLTAGAGGGTPAALTFHQMWDKTVTMKALIKDNAADGGNTVAFVKENLIYPQGVVSFQQADHNTYSGGTFVNGGRLETGTAANRRYLGNGKVTINNGQLTLGAAGATDYSAANQATYTVKNNGQIQLAANAAHNTAADTFYADADSVIESWGTHASGVGLNGLTRVASLTGIGAGQMVLEPGATVGFGNGQIGPALGAGSLTFANAASYTVPDLYYGLINYSYAPSTLTLGTGTPWIGLSSGRDGGSSFVSGTITANSDFNLRGFGPAGTGVGFSPFPLMFGSTGPVAINTPNGDVVANLLGEIRWMSASTALGSGGNDVSFVVQPGASLVVQQANAFGASPGSTAGITVKSGGTLTQLAVGSWVGAPDAFNVPSTIEAGGAFAAGQPGGLTGSGPLTFNKGAVIHLTAASGFSGSQAAAATVSPGTIVRLALDNYGSAVEPLDSYLANRSPVYEIYISNYKPANPLAPNTTVMTLNQSADGVGGRLINDHVDRAPAAVANGVIVVGPNGGTMAATGFGSTLAADGTGVAGGTVLTVAQRLALGTNALTIGDTNMYDRIMVPKLGTVILSAPAGHSTAGAGSSITVAPLATLRSAIDSIPDAADMVVNGAYAPNASAPETIGSLAGTGTVWAASALTVGRNNNSKTFSGVLMGASPFIKTGSGRQDLTGDNTKLTHNGAITVNEGILALSGAGRFTNNSGTVTLNAGGTLMLDNSGTLTTNRLNTKIIALSGGTLSLLGNGAAATTETVGQVAPTLGDSVISISGGTATYPATLIMTSAGNRSGNATITFSGIDANNIIKYASSAPALVNGILPYGFIGNDFAVVGNNTPIYAYSGYNTGDLGAYAGGTSNFNLSGPQTACNSKSVNSVKMTAGLGVTVNGGQTLTFTSGSIISDGGGNITGGTIGAGSTAWTILNSGPMTIGSGMTGSGGLVKQGAGVLTLDSIVKAFTGATYVNGGTLAYGISDALSSGDLTVDEGATVDFGNFDDANLGSVVVKNGSIVATGAGSGNTIAQGASKNITLGGGPSGSSASINSGAGKWILGGTAGSVTFDSANEPNGATIAGRLDLNGVNRSFAVGNSLAAAVDLDVPAVINGTANITKTGAGVMKLSGSNSFDGTLTVSGGTLILANSSAAGTPSGTRTATVSSGGNYTLGLDGAGISSPNIPLSLNGTGDGLVGPISGALVSMAGNNTVSGAVTLATASQIASLKVGDKLTLAGALSAGNLALTVAGNGDMELGGVVGLGTGALIKNDGGTLTLSGSGANTFSGATTVNLGKLVLGKSGTARAIASAAVNIYNGGGLKYDGTSTDMINDAAVVSLYGNGQFDMNSATDTVGNVVIAAAGAPASTVNILNTAGGGTLTIGTLGITPAGGYTTRINTGSGTLKLGGNVTFTASATGQAKISGNVALNGDRTFTVGKGTVLGPDMEIDAVISGATGDDIAKTGPGILKLSGANTFDGVLSLGSDHGTIILGNAQALGLPSVPRTYTFGAKAALGLDNTGTILDPNNRITLSFSNGSEETRLGAYLASLYNLAGTNVLPCAITIINSTTWASVADKLTIKGDVSATGTHGFTITGAGDMEISGAIKSPINSLLKNGTGTLTLSGTNTFTTQTTINSGTLALGGDALNLSFGTLGTSAVAVLLGATTGSADAALLVNGPYTVGRTVTVQAGNTGTIRLGGSNTNGTSTYTNSITLGKDVTLTSGNGGTTEFKTGVISGSGKNVTVSAPGGTVVLSAVETYSGFTTVSAGTLQVSATGRIASSTNVSVEAGAQLTLDTPNNNVIADTVTVTINSAGASFGKINLAAGNETVKALYFNGVRKSSGTWGSSASTATYKDDSRFSGTGILTVLETYKQPSPQGSIIFIASVDDGLETL
jgi:fibronectin-binding autotransporter adhesin